MTRQYILLSDDDELITGALSLTLERKGRTVIVCSDLDAAEVALAQFPVTHLVTDVQFSGEFGFEGLHFLERMRALTWFNSYREDEHGYWTARDTVGWTRFAQPGETVSRTDPAQ